MINFFICFILIPFIIYGIVIFIDSLINVYKHMFNGTAFWIQFLVCFVIGIILLAIIFLSSIVFVSLCTLIESIQTSIIELIA